MTKYIIYKIIYYIKILDLFNEFFVNIIERSTGKKSTKSTKEKSLDISTYKDHPSIKSINEQINGTGFSMPAANEKNICKILVSLNPKKAAWNDLIPLKVVVKPAEILSKPLTDKTNVTINKGIFPSNAKLATCFFYKHGVFQSEARICLSFSKIEPRNMLKTCLS